MATSASSPTAGETNNPEAPAAAPTVAETNFPETVEAPVEEAPSAPEEPEGKAGEVWATWIGQQPGERILEVRDLKGLGDKEATEELVWDRNNLWRREISDVHPMVAKYIEFDDGNFTVERF